MRRRRIAVAASPPPHRRCCIAAAASPPVAQSFLAVRSSRTPAPPPDRCTPHFAVAHQYRRVTLDAPLLHRRCRIASSSTVIPGCALFPNPSTSTESLHAAFRSRTSIPPRHSRCAAAASPPVAQSFLAVRFSRTPAPPPNRCTPHFAVAHQYRPRHSPCAAAASPPVAQSFLAVRSSPKLTQHRPGAIFAASPPSAPFSFSNPS